MAHALRHLIALMLCLAVDTVLRAQPASGSAVAVRFTVFAARPVAGLAFAPRPNAAPQSVAFYPTARSPGYEYRGSMPLRFVDTATGVVVAEATIPPGIRDAFLLFLPLENPAPGTALRYQIAVLDDGAARHAAGSLAVINLSGLALSGRVNNQTVTLSPGLNPAVRVGRNAQIVFRATQKERAYQSYAATVPLERGERALLILFPPFYKGSLEVQSRLLMDRPPRADDEPAGKTR